MKETGEVVNLDAMSIRELAAYVRDSNPRKMATRYAKSRLNAMVHHRDGRVADAFDYEGACEALYKRIPKKERWK